MNGPLVHTAAVAGVDVHVEWRLCDSNDRFKMGVNKCPLRSKQGAAPKLLHSKDIHIEYLFCAIYLHCNTVFLVVYFKSCLLFDIILQCSLPIHGFTSIS